MKFSTAIALISLAFAIYVYLEEKEPQVLTKYGIPQLPVFNSSCYKN